MMMSETSMGLIASPSRKEGKAAIDWKMNPDDCHCPFTDHCRCPLLIIVVLQSWLHFCFLRRVCLLNPFSPQSDKRSHVLCLGRNFIFIHQEKDQRRKREHHSSIHAISLLERGCLSLVRQFIISIAKMREESIEEREREFPPSFPSLLLTFPETTSLFPSFPYFREHFENIVCCSSFLFDHERRLPRREVKRVLNSLQQFTILHGFSLSPRNVLTTSRIFSSFLLIFPSRRKCVPKMKLRFESEFHSCISIYSTIHVLFSALLSRERGVTCQSLTQYDVHTRHRHTELYTKHDRKSRQEWFRVRLFALFLQILIEEDRDRSRRWTSGKREGERLSSWHSTMVRGE